MTPHIIMQDPPPLRRFERGKANRVYVQAQQIWVILVAFVEMRKSSGDPPWVTYGDVAKRMGYNKKAAIGFGKALGIIGNYCLAHDLPPLNVIVVNDISKSPGIWAIKREKYTIEQEQALVHAYEWFKVRVPSTGALRSVWEWMQKNNLSG